MTDLVAPEELSSFITDVFHHAQMPADDAAFLAQELVDAECSGYASHGLRKVGEYVDRIQREVTNPNANITIDIDRGAMVRLDGDNGFGHLVLDAAAAVAIERSKRYGIAGVAVHNSNLAGRLGDCVRKVVDHGIATLMFANTGGSVKVVAPPGGAEPRISTNPIAAGFPRADSPHFVMDFATSAVAYGHVSALRDEGKPVPEEWTTPSGHLMPFGGHKGFSLALLVDALAGALTTAGTPSEREQTEEQGVFLVAIDISSLRDVDEFGAEVEEFLTYMKSTPVADGSSPIRIPGEQGERTRKQRRETGLELSDYVRNDLLKMAETFNLEVPDFLQ